MDDDILVPVPAALADPYQIVRADQREALAHHAGRGMEEAERLDAAGAIARLLLQLADRGGDDILALLLVADQPGGQLKAIAAERHAILLDEDHLVPRRDGEDHRRADPPAARDIPICRPSPCG